MTNNTRLWPVEQLLEWLDTCDKKYCNIPPNTLPTLIAILKFADNNTWIAWPSLPRISNITGKNERTTVRNILLLERKNIITTKIRFDKYGDRDNNLYTIHPENFWKVGAKCLYPRGKMSLRYGQNVTLTTHSTTQKTKKRSLPKEQNKNANVESQSTSWKESDIKRSIKIPENAKWEEAKRRVGCGRNISK